MTSMPLSKVIGEAFILGDDVNTDIHCSNKYQPGKDMQFLSTVAFNEVSPGLATRIADSHGGILVAGENFGINSSREQAVQIMLLMNIRGIIAKSFGRQFFRNAINNGIPILECDTSTIKSGEHLEINFRTGCISPLNGIPIQTLPLPSEITNIIELGGLLAFLTAHPKWNFNHETK